MFSDRRTGLSLDPVPALRWQVHLRTIVQAISCPSCLTARVDGTMSCCWIQERLVCIAENVNGELFTCNESSGQVRKITDPCPMDAPPSH